MEGSTALSVRPDDVGFVAVPFARRARDAFVLAIVMSEPSLL